MARGFARRDGSRANGGFSDDDLRELLRKEAAMDAYNRRDYDAIPADLAIFCGIMATRAPGEGQRKVSWRHYLELTEGVNKSHKQSKEPMVQWPSFPFTESDIRKIIDWRAVQS
jgi:hypothetical protein